MTPLPTKEPTISKFWKAADNIRFISFSRFSLVYSKARSSNVPGFPLRIAAGRIYQDARINWNDRDCWLQVGFQKMPGNLRGPAEELRVADTILPQTTSCLSFSRVGLYRSLPELCSKICFMELYFVDRDIPVVVVKAEGFPQGIGGAWQKLYAAFPPEAGRNYYGISYPESPGNIIYRAAVEIPNAETAAGNGLERYTIPGGKYISTFIEDFKKDETQVAKVFQQLLHSGFVADHGICLEIYSGDKSVRCLVTHR